MTTNPLVDPYPPYPAGWDDEEYNPTEDCDPDEDADVEQDGTFRIPATPREIGLPYDEWRPNQLQALQRLQEHQEGLLCLQAPTGSGKTGIALAWGLLQAELLLPDNSPTRTLILAQRNSELDQYRRLAEGPQQTAHRDLAYIRGRRHYHCINPAHPESKAALANFVGSHQGAPEPCSDPACSEPRYDDKAPCLQHGSNGKCDYMSQCPYIVARKRASETPIVVTNYTYGMLALQMGFLGDFQSLVADEAHDLMAILTDNCSLSINLEGLADLYRQVYDNNLELQLIAGRNREKRLLYERRQEELRSNPPASGADSQRDDQEASHAGNFEHDDDELADGSLINQCREEIKNEIRKRQEQLSSITESLKQLTALEQTDQALSETLWHASQASPLLQELSAAAWQVLDGDEAEVNRQAENEKLLPGNIIARARELADLAELADTPEHHGNFAPANDFNPMQPTYQPVDLRKQELAVKRLWDRTNNALAMSGTLPRNENLEYFLGLNQEPEITRLGHQFPKENRPVYIWQQKLSLSYSSNYQDRDRVHETLNQLLTSPRLSDQKGLVLFPSYAWIKEYLKEVEQVQEEYETGNRAYAIALGYPRRERLIVQEQEIGAAAAIEEYRETREPAALLSPTAYQALDLPDDECRFVIIVRPFWPPLNRGGLDATRNAEWPGYALQTATLRMIQAAGRGFRSPEDWCDVYVIDKGNGADVIAALWHPNYELPIKPVSDLTVPAQEPPGPPGR